MHIAFMAMSGVRAASDELNRIGMTLPGFVERSKVIASLPSLSLLTLQGMARARLVASYHGTHERRPVTKLPGCGGGGSQRDRQESTTHGAARVRGRRRTVLGW